MVAAMGREVVAVDAMEDNLAYIRTSAKLSKHEHLVTLVHNAIRQVKTQRSSSINQRNAIVSATHETVYPVPLDTLNTHNSNPGAEQVVSEKELKRLFIKVWFIFDICKKT